MIGSDLSEQDFWRFSSLVYDKCGIALHEGKRELVRARISKRLREGGFHNFGSYYDYLTDEDCGDELVKFLDAISTNLTSFFREEVHFTYLKEQVFSAFESGSKSTNRLRAWSAGCSSGEEPYSMAICFMEHFGSRLPFDTKILATDLSTKVLTCAENGVYTQDRLSKVPGPVLRKYFQKGFGNQTGRYRVKDMIRNLIQFKRFNLMEPFPFRKSFDFIFCRNVMIYFDKPTQESLVKFHQCLTSGGHLFIGHSESLTGIDHPYEYIMPAVYRKQ